MYIYVCVYLYISMNLNTISSYNPKEIYLNAYYMDL